jgi:hypothetical protein
VLTGYAAFKTPLFPRRLLSRRLLRKQIARAAGDPR